MTQAPVDLLVVIICYRVPELTIDCLRSLVPELEANPGVRIALLENGTGPECDAVLRAAIDELGIADRVDYKAIEDNRGFAGGNNLLLREALEADLVPRYLLLLNADTVVHEGCFSYCLKVMDEDETIGSLSCRLLNDDGSVQNVARKLPTPLRTIVASFGLPWRFPSVFGWADTEDLTWDRDTVKRDVEWIGGAFLMVRGDLMKKIGVLDEDFVFYGEDAEYGHRVWKSGHRVHYDPAVTITHYGASSNDPVSWPDSVRSVHTWRARYIVQRNCYGILAAWAVRCADCAAWACRAIGFRLVGKPDHARQAAAALRTLLKPLRPPGAPAAGTDS